MSIAFALALIAAPAAAAPAAQADANVVFQDKTRSVVIRYDFTPTDVAFSARMTDGWAFTVGVDGDQNRAWGKGPEREGIGIEPTPDRKFGLTSHGGLCVQYVLSADPQDPSDVYSSTLCGVPRTKATVESTAVDPNDRALVTIRIPYDELFGDRPDAHLQICLWDGRQRLCQHSPAAPLVLTRPAPATKI